MISPKLSTEPNEGRPWYKGEATGSFLSTKPTRRKPEVSQRSNCSASQRPSSLAPTITAGVMKYPRLRRLYTYLRNPKRDPATKMKEIPQVNNSQPRAKINVG